VSDLRLDTHVVVWLFQNQTDKLTAMGRDLINNADQLMISPMVLLELTYLHEIGRTNAAGGDVLGDLGERIGLALSGESFAAVARSAATLTWTRDPFDRLIAGDAMAASCKLLTKDATIRDGLAALAVW
jgi:PIN domain nuclease of toxin-antitoxin system